MSLLFPGTGDIGTVVYGTSTPANVAGNGGNANIASINIPSSGVWIVMASGWLPGNIQKGYANLIADSGGTLCGTDTGQYQYSMSGILYTTQATQVKMNFVNWDSTSHNSVQSAGLRFKAVKVGGA